MQSFEQIRGFSARGRPHIRPGLGRSTAHPTQEPHHVDPDLPNGRAAGAPVTRWSWRALRLGLLAALWWVIAGGAADSWLIGVPAVLAAAWAAERLGRGPAAGVSPAGLLRFAPFFLWESLRGGIDVARRTLGWRLRIRPSFTEYRVRLRHPTARVFFANSVSLLPGTLSADLTGDRVKVHLLADDTDAQADLARLEQAVARLFGQAPGEAG
jgi:multicomponent Na+:H+ antiporter subunit E